MENGTSAKKQGKKVDSRGRPIIYTTAVDPKTREVITDPKTGKPMKVRVRVD